MHTDRVFKVNVKEKLDIKFVSVVKHTYYSICNKLLLFLINIATKRKESRPLEDPRTTWRAFSKGNQLYT